MTRRKRVGLGVAAVLLVGAGLVALASVTGIPPGGRSLAEADAVRGRIVATGLMGTRIMGLGFDPERAVFEVEAHRPDLALVRRIDEATAGSDIPVRIHWLLSEPRAL